MVERIGPYKFTGVLGRGGMGTVFRGEHEETGEVHAVKVLAPNYSQEDHFRARFESEIQALIKLDHPNIVRLISFGQESGNMFFAMEMVEGKSLFEVQRSGHKFTPPQCLAIATDVCKGLKHAHDRGIIHRDLKPGNLMMTKDRVVKITDFGIAKSFGSSQNTGNNILGTMDFMSPEQAKGEQVTARSDIYSLGTVLYTLLSGKPPFSSNSIEESFRNLTRIPAPHVSSVVPDVPEEVDQLIRRMMEKKPEKRIATAQAALHQINEAEQLLKNYSEAKTATFDPGQIDSQKTSIVGQTGQATGKLGKPAARKRDQEKLSKPLRAQSTSVKGKTQASPKADKTHLADPYETAFQGLGESVRESERDSGEFALQSPADKPDFFSTVTDEEREVAVALEDHEIHKSKGIVPLLLGLLGVILVAGIGTWYAMSNPSADELYAQIDQFRLTPERVVAQTDQFVSLYPDDDRVEEVRAMNEAGKAIDFYHDLVNKLSVRARIPGESRMTEVEDQFHDIVRLADNDISLADKKMEAFIFVHQGTEDLDPRDQDCVQAAEGFRVKHQAADSNRIEQRIVNIRATVKRAEKMVTADAVKLYRSLVKLHQDENWGQQESVRVDLLADIEQRIKRLAGE